MQRAGFWRESLAFTITRPNHNLINGFLKCTVSIKIQLQLGKTLARKKYIRLHVNMHANQTIVFRDMVWTLSKLQSGYNELCVYVEPYLTPYVHILCFRFVNI